MKEDSKPKLVASCISSKVCACMGFLMCIAGIILVKMDSSHGILDSFGKKSSTYYLINVVRLQLHALSNQV